MKVWELCQQLATALSNAGLEDPRIDAEYIITQTLGWSKSSFLVRLHDTLNESQCAHIRDHHERRCQHEPLAYIFQHTWFRGSRYYIEPGVLIPRPETEHLLDTFENDCSEDGGLPDYILECGFGSGILAIEAAKLFPAARIEAWDINPIAYQVATINQQNHTVSPVHWHCDDFFSIDRDWLVSICNSHSVCLLSNPPYISASDYAQLDPQIRRYEPETALVADHDGLTYYRHLLELCHSLPIRLFLEVGIGQKESIETLCQQYGDPNVRWTHDLAGIPRVIHINYSNP